MKAILTSIIFLSAGVYCAFINTSENVYNVLMAYSILGLLMCPLCLIVGAVIEDKDLKKTKLIPIRMAFNLTWVGVWIKMILVGYLVTGIMGLVAIICAHIMLSTMKMRINKYLEETK